jgi:hypothetical protein
MLLGIIPSKILGQTSTESSIKSHPFNPVILQSYVTSLKNAVTKLKTSGASAADFRELGTALSLVYAESQRISLDTTLDAEIRAKVSAIKAYDVAQF